MPAGDMALFRLVIDMALLLLAMDMALLLLALEPAVSQLANLPMPMAQLTTLRPQQREIPRIPCKNDANRYFMMAIHRKVVSCAKNRLYSGIIRHFRSQSSHLRHKAAHSEPTCPNEAPSPPVAQTLMPLGHS